MADPLFVPAGDLRRIWLFTVDLPEDEIKSFTDEQFNDDGDSTGLALRDALGVVRLDPDYVEVFKVETMSDYGLDRYLSEAHGMAEDQVAPDAEKLKALTGYVVLIVSKAFEERAAHFNLSDKLELVGNYSAETQVIPLEPLRSTATKGTIAGGKPGRSDAATGGRVATMVLLVLFALVCAMIWVSGQ